MHIYSPIFGAGTIKGCESLRRFLAPPVSRLLAESPITHASACGPSGAIPALAALLGFVVFAGLAVAQPALPKGPEIKVSAAGASVGGKCAECHQEVVNSFVLGPHGKAAQFLKGTQSASCETCHRDGARHSQTSRPSHIANPPKLPAAEVNAMCLTCHTNDQTHFAWRGNAHERKDMSCVSCHNEHHPASKSKMLSKKNEMELCFNCHQDKRKATLQRSTHFFRTEHRDVKLACASCHNPHGGEGKAMLAASSVNALCFECHAEKRGPFLWEHAPGRSNCNSCHLPHGSNNPSLLKARTSVLCQQCHIHMLWRHQTIAGYDISSFNKGCVNCHSQVHGSNHPSGKTFTH